MFSGLVETKSKIVATQLQPGGILLVLQRPREFDDLATGDSVAVQGCCLTVVELDADTIGFQAGQETLSRTTFADRAAGEELNMERSLRLSDRLGGHLVTGHVDCLARVRNRSNLDQWSDLVFTAPEKQLQQMAAKGSVTVDGVSLTVVDVTADTFSVALIPHTLQTTTLGSLHVGSVVHLETDLLAKYVERQLVSVPLREVTG